MANTTISNGAVRKGEEKIISRPKIIYYSYMYEEIKWFTRYAYSHFFPLYLWSLIYNLYIYEGHPISSDNGPISQKLSL